MMRAAQRGVSLVVALFLIVILALLAAFAVTLGTAQREQANLSILAGRALQAARSGAEWAGTRALLNNACAAATVLNLTQGALAGYRVTVNCAATSHLEGAVNYNIYDVTAFAQLGRFGSVTYVSSTVTARFTNAP